jgi:hypothetical protein
MRIFDYRIMPNNTFLVRSVSLDTGMDSTNPTTLPLSAIEDKRLLNLLVKPKKINRIHEMVRIYDETQKNLADLMCTSVTDPRVIEKMHLRNWYSGNNQASLFNLAQIVQQTRFEIGVDKILSSTSV